MTDTKLVWNMLCSPVTECHLTGLNSPDCVVQSNDSVRQILKPVEHGSLIMTVQFYVATIPTMSLLMDLTAISTCGGPVALYMCIDSLAVPPLMNMSVDSYGHVSICCSLTSFDAGTAVCLEHLPCDLRRCCSDSAVDLLQQFRNPQTVS